jgi:hypothetical protein
VFHCEISEAKRSDGRRRVKLVLHEIHQDRNHYNKNGISYNEQYVRDNADSIIGMPICATFLDSEKDIPYDHGMTGQDGNMPLFENSVQVGSADGWSIEDIQINGEKHKVLIAEGYINQQRYPHFVEWLENKINDGDTIYGSVEFVGKGKNKIVYDGEPVEKGRVPKVYDYSGYCILTVEPSDNSAILIELNQKIKEDEKVDEKTLNQIISAVENKITELNTKNADYESKIAEMNEIIFTKDAEIATLTDEKATAETNACQKDEKINELNGLVETMKAELNELKKSAKIAELNSALGDFSDDEKNMAKDKLDKFNADPMGCGIEVNDIVTEINACIGAETKKKEKAMAVEINSQNNFAADIFGCVDTDNDDDKNDKLDIDNLFV